MHAFHPFLCPPPGLGWEEGAEEGVHEVSFGIPLGYPRQGISCSPLQLEAELTET